MKITQILCLISLLLSPPAHAEQDKFLHASGSYVLTAIMLEKGYSRSEAFWATMFVGLMKESLDSNTPTESLRDMGANMLGSGLAVITWRVEL